LPNRLLAVTRQTLADAVGVSPPPEGGLTMIRATEQAPPRQLVRGIAMGLAIHAAVFAVAFLSARL
jgi:hypothetical protein